jgi:hypothetical protein
MPFLIVAGITVPVMEGAASERPEESAVDVRAVTGALRTAVVWEKRSWSATTGLLTNAEAAALKAAVAMGAHVTCSGDMLGGSMTCRVHVTEGAYINVTTDDGTGAMRTLGLTIRQV